MSSSFQEQMNPIIPHVGEFYRSLSTGTIVKCTFVYGGSDLDNEDFFSGEIISMGPGASEAYIQKWEERSSKESCWFARNKFVPASENYKEIIKTLDSKCCLWMGHRFFCKCNKGA